MFRPHTTGEVFNLGSTEEHAVLEFAHTIIRLCNASSSIIFASSRIDDPERRRPDISKAQHILGWQPKISLEEGLQRTIEWFSSQSTHLSIIS
jgi:nucleoside-diphosphate-sugar epimerase